MIFYDFEVTKYDWLVVMIDPVEQQIIKIANDQPKLLDVFDQHKNDLWIGFNNHHYDDYILKGLLCEMDPYDINNYIIVDHKPGWKYSNLFRKIPIISYDVFQSKIDRGLKYFEGSLGNMVKETSVPFDIDRPLTDEELDEMFKYCQHDVEQTIEVFLHRKSDFDAIVSLIKMFPEVLSIRDIGLTKAQISAKILECERTSRHDEFDLSVLPCIQVKHKTAVDWFMAFKNTTQDPKEVYEQSLVLDVASIPHTMGWGGIHAGKEKYQNLGAKQGRQIWHVDVASFYPRLMIYHNLLTRNSKKPEKFKQIYYKRIELKHAGKKKEQAPLKIVINGTYGISKAETSTAYDPRQANMICMNGQLMLIDLIEHLESIDGFELIQSNTDGLIISLPNTDEAFEQMDDICFEWESRCNMALEFDEISWIKQKDVNNYIFQFSNGKLERKGAYVKELSDLNYDLPIVNKAVVDFLAYGVPVEYTITNCNDLKEFQMVKKIGYQYTKILYGGYWHQVRKVNPNTGKLKQYVEWSGTEKSLNERCIRIYAKEGNGDDRIWKVKDDGAIEKMEGTPEHCFIWNDEVNGVKCPSYLDKRWYIEQAKERLKGFGYV